MTGQIQHGGNQLAIRARLKLGDRPLRDFSAPLNALGPPPGAVAEARRVVDSIDRYPEPGSPRLVEFLADFHRVPAESILVGAGTTELISLLALSFLEAEGPRRDRPRLTVAHLVEPTYGEYRRSSVQVGLHPELYPEPVLGWEQDFFPSGGTGIFWTGHPNNPTGRAWDRARLLGLVDGSPDLLTVVDEAYLPFLPDEAARTVVGAVAGRSNLAVLRSLTKIYAIPGLRVGYMVAPPGLVERLRRFQQPWTVARMAEAAAIAAMRDDEYLERTVELIGRAGACLCDRLWDIPGLRPAWPDRRRPATAPAAPNFVLVSVVDTEWTSKQLLDALARRGLLVRECSNYHRLECGSRLHAAGGRPFETRGHLRFCVRTPAENDHLLANLAELMATRPPAA